MNPATTTATRAASPALTVGELIDSRPLGAFQLQTMLLCGLVLVLDGFDAQTAGAMGAAISEGLHIPLKSMGYVFSASLFGLMIASMAAGPIADRWGRKWPVIASVLTFAVFSLLTARAVSYDALLVFRFLTGLGLGGAMPTVVSIACEYSPKRLERTIVAMLFTGMAFGNFICGLLGAQMLPRWGWRSVFYVGAFVPLAFALLLIAVLPESIRFLAGRGADPKRLGQIAARLVPQTTRDTIAVSEPREPRGGGQPVVRLFTDGRATATVLLWIPFFMNLLLLYFMINWLPALLRQSGTSISLGVRAVMTFSLGGIAGSLAEGPLIDSFGPFPMLLSEFLVCAALIGSLAYTITSVLWLLFGIIFVLGFCVTGAQAGINALAASFYPTSIRSTGVGWALGVGRIGSIVGPIIAGGLLSLRWTPQRIFLAGAAPAFCAALAVALSFLISAKSSAYRQQSPASGS